MRALVAAALLAACGGDFDPADSNVVGGAWRIEFQTAECANPPPVTYGHGYFGIGLAGGTCREVAGDGEGYPEQSRAWCAGCDEFGDARSGLVALDVDTGELWIKAEWDIDDVSTPVPFAISLFDDGVDGA